jgi:dipeptidyl aminopeptidase/acylaminoacyl peptidase
VTMSHSRRLFLSGAAVFATAAAGSALAGPRSPGFHSTFDLAPTTPAQAPGAARRIPLRDFFRNPEKSNFQISPDGARISFMQSYQRRLNVFVQARAGGPAVRVTGETERDVADYIWKGPGRIVYLKDFKGDENFHVVSVDADGKNLVDLTPFDNVRAELIDVRRDQDDEIIIGLNRRNPEVFDAYRLDLKAKALTLIAQNPGNITSWVTDHDGRIRVAITNDGVNTSLLYRTDETSAFTAVLTTSFKEEIKPHFFGFDNKGLYASSNINRDKSAIVLLDPATAKEESVIFEHPDVDVSELAWSRKRKVLTEAEFTTWKRERKFFDAEMEAIHRDLERQLPGYEIDLHSRDKNEGVYIVRASNDRTRGAYYLYEVATKQLTELARTTPWLDEKELVEIKPITYQARDGLTIHGYLTLPHGGGRNLPLIVLPHGGPWHRDTWSYDAEVQFLANRGYAVLQMNFRGSTGYGRKFWEASFKQWGKKMQDDISDGVNYAVKEGIADPKRVCIYGASYGGYATLAGLAFTPELYACGVDYVGVSNIFTFLQTIPPYWKPMLDMLYEMIGHPEHDKALLEAASPVMHADKIRAPLFIAQGAKDPRVNVDESDQMVAALKKRGIDVEYLVKENEGHGFQNEENRFEFYEAMERFLAKHLGGAAP